jgi:hypothetical protein
MPRRLLQHLRSNLVAYLALFAGLTSTGYAATTKLLPANSVGTRQVINNSLLKVDFKKGQLPRGARGLPGRTGPAGPPGAAGPQGPPGSFTSANVSSADGPVVHMCAFTGGQCATATSIATCPAGKVPIGGAWAGDAPDPIFAATPSASYPYPGFTDHPTGWAVVMVNNADATASFHASAICAG